MEQIFRIWELVETNKYQMLEEINVNDIIEAVKIAKEKYPDLSLRVSSEKGSVEFNKNASFDEMKINLQECPF